METAKLINIAVEAAGEHATTSYLEWLAVELKFSSYAEFQTYRTWSDKPSNQLPSPGHQLKITTKTAKTIAEFWFKNSVISVDRRNMRHTVRIKPANIHPAARNVIDPNIEILLNGKLQAQRYIYTTDTRNLYKQYLKQNEYVSYSSFYRLKPFYIMKPTLREQESCMCIKCLNIHCIYKSLRTNCPELDLPDSLTEYLTSSFRCMRDENIKFHKLECINSTCSSTYKIKSSIEQFKFDNKKPFSFYMFKSLTEKYFNKQGQPKEYTRTARVDDSATTAALFEMLNQRAKPYLLHRYAVVSDKVFWNLFQQKHPFIHIDYSENIQISAKHEAQSAYYSGKQHTLHCTVMSIDGTPEFIYHLSDDTNKDSTLTSTILKSIIEQFPRVIRNRKLVIMSDNASTQYKSKYVFKRVQQIAQ